jgi:hypothetical protein
MALKEALGDISPARILGSVGKFFVLPETIYGWLFRAHASRATFLWASIARHSRSVISWISMGKARHIEMRTSTKQIETWGSRPHSNSSAVARVVPRTRLGIAGHAFASDEGGL